MSSPALKWASQQRASDLTFESGPGFVQYKRSHLADEINRDCKAFALLGLIARRARRRNEPNEFNLETGECLLGCNDSAGLTREEYRGALRRLKGKWRQIETRPFRGGSCGKKRGGTIVKLISTDVFNINADTNFREGAEIQPSRKQPRIIGETRHQQPLKQPSSNHRATIEQPLTNKEIRKQTNNDDGEARGRSLPRCKATAESSSSALDYLNHPKYPEFDRYCESKGGTATKKGFYTWLGKQSPERAESKRAWTSNRNIGTLNEGKSDQYRGLGKIAPQPEGWHKWVNNTYPEARVRDWAKLKGAFVFGHSLVVATLFLKAVEQRSVIVLPYQHSKPVVRT